MFEDEFLPATDLAKKLTEIGYEVIDMFASAEKGLAFLEETKGTDRFPDAVLLDITLKGKISGIEAARIISEKYGCGIVFLSALSLLSVIEQAFGDKAYPFLFKPFDPYQVHIGLQVAVRIAKLEQENQKFGTI
jgi:AmiR/NasT family two-component response regulator